MRRVVPNDRSPLAVNEGFVLNSKDDDVPARDRAIQSVAILVAVPKRYDEAFLAQWVLLECTAKYLYSVARWQLSCRYYGLFYTRC